MGFSWEIGDHTTLYPFLFHPNFNPHPFLFHFSTTEAQVLVMPLCAYVPFMFLTPHSPFGIDPITIILNLKKYILI